MSISNELADLENLFRNGTLSLEELETAKRLVLSGNSAGATDQLEEIKNQNEIAQLDRQWSLEREKYMIRNRRGFQYIPTKGSSVVGGMVIVIFGVFWTVVAASITAYAPFPIAKFFPVFGILFIVLGAASAIRSYSKADQYTEAEAIYLRRRQDLLDKRT